jgi:hypothetical protein
MNRTKIRNNNPDRIVFFDVLLGAYAKRTLIEMSRVRILISIFETSRVAKQSTAAKPRACR